MQARNNPPGQRDDEQMTMLWANDKLYTYYDHFLERAEERGIRLNWVQQVMNDPDEITYSKSTGRYLYDKYVEDAGQSVRVVVDEDEAMLVTTHYIPTRKDESEA